MPWIFLLLMLLNGAYFGWEFMQKGQGGAHVSSPSLQEGNLILLLSERAESAEAPAANVHSSQALKESKEDASAESPVGVSQQCFNVGPFEAQPELLQFDSAIRSNGFHSRIEKRKVNDKKYWVFIPPFTNRAKAEEKLRDLKARGITGFVVREGVFINAVSLNNFSQKELADAFLGDMQKAGIPVEYREVTKSGTESWVYVSPAQSKHDLRAVVDDFLAKHGEIRREISACDE